MKRYAYILCAFLWVGTGCSDAVVSPAAEDIAAEREARLGKADSGPVLVTPFTATTSLVTIDPGPDVQQDGVWQIRNMTKTGVLTGGLTGTVVIYISGDVDLATGEGPSWGTFLIESDQGNWSGQISGAFHDMGQVLVTEFSGRSDAGTAKSRIRATVTDAGSAPESDDFVLTGEIISQQTQM